MKQKSDEDAARTIEAELADLEARFRKTSNGNERLTLGLELGKRLADHGAYDRSIAIVEQVEPLAVDEEARIQVLQRLGQAHLRLSQYQKAYLYLGDALTRLSSRPSSLELFQVYYDIAWMFMRQGYPDSARSYSDGARMVLDGMDQDLDIRRQRAEVLHIAALIEAASGNHHTAIGLLQEEAGYHRETGDEHRLAAVYNKLASVNYTLGEVSRALEFQGLTHSLALKNGDRFRLALSHKNYGDIHFILGDYGRAREHYQQSDEVCRSINNGLGQVFATAAIGRIRCLQGDAGQAKKFLDQALDLARALGNRDRESCVLVDLAEWNCCQSRIDAALGCLELSEGIEKERGQAPSPRMQVIKARALLLQESVSGAIQVKKLLDGILTGPLRIDDEEMTAVPELEAESRLLLARACLRQSLRDQAVEAAKEAVRFLDDMAVRIPDEYRPAFKAKDTVAVIYRFLDELRG